MDHAMLEALQRLGGVASSIATLADSLKNQTPPPLPADTSKPPDHTPASPSNKPTTDDEATKLGTVIGEVAGKIVAVEIAKLAASLSTVSRETEGIAPTDEQVAPRPRDKNLDYLKTQAKSLTTNYVGQRAGRQVGEAAGRLAGRAVGRLFGTAVPGVGKGATEMVGQVGANVGAGTAGATPPPPTAATTAATATRTATTAATTTASTATAALPVPGTAATAAASTSSTLATAATATKTATTAATAALPTAAGSTATTAAAAAGATGSAATAATAALSNPVTAIAAPVLAAGLALKQFHDAVASNSKALLEYNRTLGQFSGLMAQQMAVFEIEDQARGREVGDRLTESAKFLGESDQTRKENTKEISILVDKIENYLGALLNGVATIAVWPFNQLAKAVNAIAEDGKEKDLKTLSEQLQDAADKSLEKDERDAERRRRADDR